MKLDGTTTATLARSLSGLPPDERGWITFTEARSFFSTKGDQYAFGETDDDGRKNIESFAAQHQSVINFIPIEGGFISYAIRGPVRALIKSASATACDFLFASACCATGTHATRSEIRKRPQLVVEHSRALAANLAPHIGCFFVCCFGTPNDFSRVSPIA
jgi:hypothetical protein